jgi:3-dehydroquinate dehydratase-1
MAAVEQLLASPSPGPVALKNDSNGFSGAPRDPNTMDIDRPSQSPAPVPDKIYRDAPKVGDRRIFVVIHDSSQEGILSIFAEVLGQPLRLKKGLGDVGVSDNGHVIGIRAAEAKNALEARDRELVVVVNAHCVDLGMPPDAYLSTHCDYEFLYTHSPFLRRYLAKFTSFVLGQIVHHDELMAKPRTFFISTTFPNVSAALPNLDILTVGADAVEIRVDLLREPLGNGKFSDIPSLSYVGQQLMLLRQRTELPILFTTRCTNENGKFPMDNPELYYEYLYRAIQWGVEYIDVELWLPESIRQRLYQIKGNSRVLSAFHDFSGTFKWPSEFAQQVYTRSAKYADMVRMMVIINEHNENFELEYFRSKIRSDHPNGPPLCAVNMGEAGQFSRLLNKVFTPITHPLLPIIAAPGQMSTAEIHAALSLLGQLPKKNIFGISSSATRHSTPRAPFYEKCFNELGLPHQFAFVERPVGNAASMDTWCNQRQFGGAYVEPGIPFQNLIKQSPFFSTLNSGTGPTLTEAARAIGIIDTIVVKTGSSSTATSTPPSMPSSPPSRYSGSFGPGSQSGLPPNTSLIFDNAGWKGILSTLTRDLAPSAYSGRSAIVLASSSDDAAPVYFALKALNISKIYTVGFRTPPTLARNAPPIEPFVSMESLQRARSGSSNSTSPFLIASALAPEKSNLVGMLLRVFGAPGIQGVQRKVFLDLAGGAARQSMELAATAEKCGFTPFSAADVSAFTTVESLRLLVGQNVPYSFVSFAGGRSFH